MPNNLSSRPYTTPKMGASQNWLKYKQAGDQIKLGDSGSGLAKAGVITSGIGNMLGDIGGILEEYETTKTYKKLADTPPDDPNYDNVMMGAIKSAPNAKVAESLMTLWYKRKEFMQELETKRQEQQNKQEDRNVDLTLKGVDLGGNGGGETQPQAMPTEPNQPTSTAPESQEKYKPLTYRGKQIKVPLGGSKQKAKEFTNSDFATKFKEVPQGTPGAQKIMVSEDGVKTPKWGKPFSQVNLEERQLQFDRREYNDFIGTALGAKGVRMPLAQQAMKWAVAQDQYSVLMGALEGKYVVDKRLALLMMRALDNLSVMGSGGGGSSELVEGAIDDIGGTLYSRWKSALEKITSDPQTFLRGDENTGFIKQFMNELKRQVDVWGSQVDATLRSQFSSKDPTLWKRHPEWKQAAFDSIKERFKLFFKLNPNANAKDLEENIKEDMDTALKSRGGLVETFEDTEPNELKTLEEENKELENMEE